MRDTDNLATYLNTIIEKNNDLYFPKTLIRKKNWNGIKWYNNELHTIIIIMNYIHVHTMRKCKDRQYKLQQKSGIEIDKIHYKKLKKKYKTDTKKGWKYLLPKPNNTSR